MERPHRFLLFLLHLFVDATERRLPQAWYPAANGPCSHNSLPGDANALAV